MWSIQQKSEGIENVAAEDSDFLIDHEKLKNRSSYGGIFAFHDLHCEIRSLFRSQEVRSMNHGGRQIFDVGDNDVNFCVLGELYRFRQFDFAPLDDCFIRQNLHQIQLTTGSAGGRDRYR